MSKVMILTASTGAGHNQAAKSLQLKYEGVGHQVQIVDILKETHRAYDRVIGDGYEFVAANMPELYKAMYEVADMKTFNQLANRYGLPGVNTRLDKIIKKNKPEVIIATHPFAVGIVTSLKRKRVIDAKFISIVTDFRAHFAYYSQEVDAYIVGSEYTKKSLVTKGIPARKVHPFGIPINLAFLDVEKQSNRSGCARHSKDFNVLVMAGSMGVSKIAEVIKEVVENDNYKVNIVCGKNEKLFEQINQLYKKELTTDRVSVYGFTREIPQLMSKADILITKPGGLTTTEALQKNVPMIIPFAIPGQEEENADFLEEQGVAVRASSPEAVGRCVAKLYHEQALHNRMINKMKEISKLYSIDSIIELSENLLVGELFGVESESRKSSARVYI